jgi:hypothetical protein
MLETLPFPALLRSPEELPAGLIKVTVIVSAVSDHAEKPNLHNLRYCSANRSAVHLQESGKGLLRWIAPSRLPIEMI